MKKFVFTSLIMFLSLGLMSAEKSGIDESLLLEAKAGMRKSVNYILAKRNAKNGSWGPYGGHPAYTSMITTALMGSPFRDEKKVKTAITEALKYIATFAQKDGSIWQVHKKQYPNYTTSVSLMALYLSGDKQYHKICMKARTFIKKSQFTDGNNLGGIGYGSDQTKSDLSNTQMALEALHLTESLEKDNATPEERAATKLCWERAKKFLTRCQKSPKNDEKWSKENTDKNDDGGAVYSPDRSKALNDDGSLRTYGSMTYALLKSMLHAKMSKDDIRVVSAMGWASRHYTVDENPGVKLQGHFYYMHTFTKALHATGKNVLIDKNGKKNFWRKDIVSKLLSMQKAEGQWVNSEGRWQESVPELATAYALLAMEYALATEKL